MACVMQEVRLDNHNNLSGLKICESIKDKALVADSEVAGHWAKFRLLIYFSSVCQYNINT